MLELFYMFSFLNKSKNNKRVYLDYAGATPIGVRAKRALLETLDEYGNPSAIYKEGVDAKKFLNIARKKIGDVINARSHEIYFVGSGTESCNLAIFGTYHNWKKENEHTTKLPHIIVSAIEHPAVMEAVTHLAINNLANITVLPVYENGIVKVQDVKNAITPETILISVMYANNEIGTVQPIKEIGRVVAESRKQKAESRNTDTGNSQSEFPNCQLPSADYPLLHTDACQAGNYLNLDVFRLKVDLMTLNSSKVYGPKGIAVLYKKESVKLSPIILGGGQERDLRSGTEALPLAVSFAEALVESQEIKEKESERLTALRDKFKEELNKRISNVTFYGEWEDRKQEAESRKQKVRSTKHEEMLRLPNNINCRIPGIISEEMILRLDVKGFAISHKSACASQIDDSSYVIKALGASDTEAKENVRITLGRSTKWEDLEKLIDAIEEISNKFSMKQ